MKRLSLILVLFVVLISCGDDDDKGTSKTQLLTGGSSKTWYLYAITGADDPCPSTEDDDWTFFADGKFEHDNGDITDSPDESCGDLVNFIGEWEFEQGETRLTARALYETEDPTNTFDFELFDALEIETLTEERLILKGDDDDQTVEFRAR